MSVYFQSDEQRIIVHGKTYPYRELMRTLGGYYQASDKTWSLPYSPENLQQIDELCRSVGGGPRREPAPTAPSATPARDAETLPEGSAPLPADPLVDGLTIGELLHKAQLVIAQGFPRSVWVVGEIQNFRSHASGLYFQLADAKEGASRSATQTVQATLWRSQLLDIERKLGRDTVRDLLQDGIRVRILVDVSLYKDRAQLSLQVQHLDPNFTKGSLALARERLLRELRSKGLDQVQKRLALARFPFHIGLITASDSRALSDFVDQLQVYRFPGHISFYASQMQGERTLVELVRGLETLTARACDLIVITRGGGSAADLRWFDSPEIAYAIAQCPVPIIAAIGHHEDVCVAEEIAYQREKTPTAAADFIVAWFQKTRQDIDQWMAALSRAMADLMRIQDQRQGHLREKLLLAVQQVLNTHVQHLVHVESLLGMQIERAVLKHRQALESWSIQLQKQAFQRILGQEKQLHERCHHLEVQGQRALFLQEQRSSEQKNRLAVTLSQVIQSLERRCLELGAQIRQRDPQPWLEQGWTQLSSPEGRITSGRQLREGQTLHARLPDARLRLMLDSIEIRERN